MLLLLRFPAVNQSFIGAPDREMIEMAFRFRADLIGGRADPVLFLDFDDATMSKLGGNKPFSTPPQTAPRAALAQLLDFIRSAPPDREAHAVVLDVDVSAPGSDGDAGTDKLKSALAAWAGDKNAPPLVMIREPYPAAAAAVDRPSSVLTDTPYDAIVQPAGNIYWSEGEALADLNGVMREFQPYDCVIINSASGAHEGPLYSAALIAYQFAETNRSVLEAAPAKHWWTEATSRCQNPGATGPSHGEMIDYHLSMGTGFLGRVWPPLDPGWPGFAACGRTVSSTLLRISVVDVLDALSGGGADTGVLCQHVVIIGGTNSSAHDFVQTPLDQMSGSIVLANSIRGLQLTHGGLQPIILIGQVFLLALVSLAISASAAATSRARRHYLSLREGRHKDSLVHRLAILPLNPILLNGVIALTAHFVGVALLVVSLNFGFWGFLSAPAFAAAITETIQEVSNG